MEIEMEVHHGCSSEVDPSGKRKHGCAKNQARNTFQLSKQRSPSSRPVLLQLPSGTPAPGGAGYDASKQWSCSGRGWELGREGAMWIQPRVQKGDG